MKVLTKSIMGAALAALTASTALSADGTIRVGVVTPISGMT